MKIFYPYRFDPTHNSGGTIHIRQFIAHLETLGDQVVTFRGNPARSDLGYPRSRVGRLAELRSFDLIYERLEHRAPNGGWYGRLPRLLMNHPIIAWEFNTVPEFGELLGGGHEAVEREKSKFRHLAPLCDVAFCVSDSLSAYAREELGIQHTVTVPNGSDPDHFSPFLDPAPRLSFLREATNVIWMGSAELAWHDLDLLRRVALDLWHGQASQRIVIHVLARELRNVAGMPPNVLFHGAVPYDELPRWLSGCDIGLIAYKQGPADYSSPLKLFDYLASGLAVVSTEQPQVRQVLEQIGGADLVVPVGDNQRMADTLVTLAKDRNRMGSLGQAGRELVQAKYRWEQNAKSIRSELEQLLHRRRGGQ